MIEITLKDGSVKSYDAPLTAADAVKDISMGLFRSSCAVKINGEVKDLRTEITENCSLEALTFDDEDGHRAFNHTASHILAQAVQHLFPAAKFAIGPIT